MSTNLVLFAWNRAVAGREAISGQHFQEFSEYLNVQKRDGLIESFEAVLLEPHGGSLNGFFLLRGEPDGFAKLLSSDDWARHQARAILNLEGAAVLRGVTGTALMKRMAMWMQESSK